MATRDGIASAQRMRWFNKGRISGKIDGAWRLAVAQRWEWERAM